MVILLAATFAASAWSQTYVKPHVRKDGTYVEGHYRSSPDSSRLNNYSTQGNYNPYNGQTGTVNPYQPVQPSYVPVNPVTVNPTPRCYVAGNGQYVCR
jgi:hypothetical protein